MQAKKSILLTLDNVQKVDADKRPFFIGFINMVELQKCQTLREQVKIVHDRLFHQNLQNLKKNIMQFFGIENYGTFNAMLKRGSLPEQKKGRKNVIPNYVQEDLYRIVLLSFNQKIPLTLYDASDYLQTIHNIEINDDTLRKILYRKFKTVKASPTDINRILIQKVDIVSWFLSLKKEIEYLHPALIINFDEAGCVPREDIKSKKVFVPIDVEISTSRIVVEKDIKRMTVIATIALDGSFASPFLISSQHRCSKSLSSFGFNASTFNCCNQQNAFIDSYVVIDYAEKTLIPFVKQQRLKYSLADDKALLIMDGCTAHNDPLFLEILSDNNIEPFYLLPHSSHLTQPLDLVIFSALKSSYRKFITKYKALPVSLQQMLSVLSAYDKAVNRTNVNRSFQLIGLVPFESDIVFKASEAEQVLNEFSDKHMLDEIEIPILINGRKTFDIADPHFLP
jgi:hypothetical protein